MGKTKGKAKSETILIARHWSFFIYFEIQLTTTATTTKNICKYQL